MVALSSEDFKTWLNGLQLILHLGTERSLKVRIRDRETYNFLNNKIIKIIMRHH